MLQFLLYLKGSTITTYLVALNSILAVPEVILLAYEIVGLNPPMANNPHKLWVFASTMTPQHLLHQIHHGRMFLEIRQSLPATT